MQKVITPPITGRLTGGAELNRIIKLRQICAVNNADPSARGLKFIKICRDKRGWHLKPKHFPLSSFFKEKLNFFQNILGVYKFVQSFWRLSCKRKATRETTPRSNRMENRTCKQLKICFLRTFPRQSQALAQTLFSSVQEVVRDWRPRA